MSVVRILPNGHIVLLLTPREATMLEGQILDPSEFPWQDSEAQFSAMIVKGQLKSAVEVNVARELDKTTTILEHVSEAARREEAAKVNGDPEEPRVAPEDERPSEVAAEMAARKGSMERLQERLRLRQLRPQEE